jgi:ribosome-binding protein aMBF1 (putative translation factor)
MASVTVVAQPPTSRRERWYRDNIPVAQPLYIEYTAEEDRPMAKRTPRDWGRLLAETRKQRGLSQKHIAATLGVTTSRVSQIEHGRVTSFEVIARYIEALGGRLDLVAEFRDRIVRLQVSDTWTKVA